jgi:membrane protease YdiL (CAAX protease family)
MFFQIAKKGLNEWWRYGIGLVFVLFCLGIGQMLVFALLSFIVNRNPNVSAEELEQFFVNPDFSLLDISKNMGLVLLVCSFAVALIGLWLVVKYIHGRPFKTIITPHSNINWGKIFFGFGVWLGIGLVFEIVQYLANPELYHYQLNLGPFLILIVIALVILPIQTSMEELLIRGYLMQGVGVIAKNRWTPLVVTTLVFGLMHAMNPEIAKYGFWKMELYYLLAGLFLGIVTIMDDSLELVIGMHAATNFFGAVILSYEASAIQTDSLFRAASVDPIWLTLLFLIYGIVFYFIAAKKYNWPSIRKVWSKIEYPEDLNT